MPELPEVETVVRGLRDSLEGRTITGLRTYWPRHIAAPADTAELKHRLLGSQILSLGRRGKYLLFHLDSPDTLIMHLKMSGNLGVFDAADPLHRHDRTVFELDNGQELRFEDMRKFGKVYLVANTETVLGKLGPEPLEDSFTLASFRQRFAGRSRVIKPLLLDQTFVAGVGNIYADEALHQAGIHPQRRADTLTKGEVARLHAAIRAVLQTGIDKQGATLTTYRQPDGRLGGMQNEFAIYDRGGEPCFRCGQPVVKIVVGGRGTHYCPGCQK